jgi:hypothetical protein
LLIIRKQTAHSLEEIPITPLNHISFLVTSMEKFRKKEYNKAEYVNKKNNKIPGSEQ